jgi:hypothetical protein
MPKYDVHVYATFRVKVSGVEAPDAVAACRSTLELNLNRYASPDLEFADEVTGYLVDHENDPEHTLSQAFTAAQVEDH